MAWRRCAWHASSDHAPHDLKATVIAPDHAVIRDEYNECASCSLPGEVHQGSKVVTHSADGHLPFRWGQFAASVRQFVQPLAKYKDEPPRHRLGPDKGERVGKVPNLLSRQAREDLVSKLIAIPIPVAVGAQLIPATLVELSDECRRLRHLREAKRGDGRPIHEAGFRKFWPFGTGEIGQSINE